MPTSEESKPTFWQAEPSFFLQRRAEPSRAFCSQNLAKPSFRLSKLEQFLTTVESGYRGKVGQHKIVLYNQVSSIKRVGAFK